jgi:hypothetical protein
MAVCKRPLRCVHLVVVGRLAGLDWAEDGADTLVVCHPLFRASCSRGSHIDNNKGTACW